MQFNEDKQDTQFAIRSYEPGQVQINDDIYTNNLIIGPNELITDWPVANIDDLTEKSWEIILTRQPDILLIGTGPDMTLIHPSILASLHTAGIGVEVMSTPAACRTFVVLMAEHRNAMAALLL